MSWQVTVEMVNFVRFMLHCNFDANVNVDASNGELPCHREGSSRHLP